MAKWLGRTLSLKNISQSVLRPTTTIHSTPLSPEVNKRYNQRNPRTLSNSVSICGTPIKIFTLDSEKSSR